MCLPWQVLQRVRDSTQWLIGYLKLVFDSKGFKGASWREQSLTRLPKTPLCIVN